MKLENKIKSFLKNYPDLELAILYGSFSSGKENSKSDIDIAIAIGKPLTLEERIDIASSLSRSIKKKVDLIDLLSTEGLLLKEVLTNGKVLVKNNVKLFEKLLKKMLYYKADFLPYQKRILEERRKRWIGM